MPTKIRSRLGVFAIIGTLIGAIIGLGLGMMVAELEREAETRDIAQQFIAQVGEINQEVVTTLARAHGSGLKHCSDEDLAFLRVLVVNSRFLKAVARLDGRIMRCNSLMGRLEPAPAVRAPDIVWPDGRGVRLNTELRAIPGARGMLVEQWGLSVVIGPQSYSALANPRLDYTLAVDVGGERRVLSASTPPPPMPQDDLSTGKPVSINGMRYEVACSHETVGCVAARLKPGADDGRLYILAIFSLMGAITGLGTGLGVSAARARYWSLANRLLLALRADEITVVYQPIVRLVDRKITGVEVLARWNPSGRQAIPPDLFVAAAEQGGFVVELTQYVIRRTLAEMAPTLRQRPDLSISINIAAEDLLHPSFNDFIADVCNFHRVSRRCMSFEITERSTIERKRLDTGIGRLRAAGHRIYIDDFGVQYSNLSYLVDLQIDAVKLDRSFTMSVGTGGKGAIIAAQIAGMVAGLNMNMVVEGIETEEQAAYFAALPGDIHGQGWLFGRPVEVAETIRLIDGAGALSREPATGA